MFPSTWETSSPAPRLWRARAGRALGLAWAFLTLDEASCPPSPAEPPHPHRRPLQSQRGLRRPAAAGGAHAAAARSPLGRRQAPFHHRDRLRVVVDEHVPPTELRRDRPERPAPGERVQTPIPGPRRGLDDASEHAGGLLRRIAGLLAPGG